MMINKFMLLCIVLVFDYVIAKSISEIKCDETASLLTDPRSIAPYMMEIRIMRDSDFFSKPDAVILSCSATLISESYVLTSALCVNNLKFHPFEAIVKIRKLKFAEEEYTNSKQFTVNRIISHALFNYASLENQYDYALIELNEVVPYQNNISIFRPACLWTDLVSPFDTFLMFGHVSRNGLRLAIFQNITTANIDLCLDFIKYKMVNRSLNINQSHMCFIISQSASHSNQANPIVANIGNQTYIFGIESRTYTNGTTNMIWSHKIYNVIPWIESIVWPNYTHLNCGERKIINKPLMVHAQPTYHGEFPWHVALYKNDQNYICGGTIIDKRSLLTAAHCVYDERGILPPNRLTIVAGTHNLDERPIEAEIYVVESIISHPNFNRTYLVNDIAVLRLKRAIDFSNFIQPICLSKTIDYDNITLGLVAGWGLDEHGRSSNVLLQATLPIRNNYDCLNSNPDFFHDHLNDHNYCAGYQNGTNVCSGDSGSAMIFEYKSKWHIRGIVSQGVALPNSDRCDITELVLFTNVPKLYDWIVENVQDEQ